MRPLKLKRSDVRPYINAGGYRGYFVDNRKVPEGVFAKSPNGNFFTTRFYSDDVVIGLKDTALAPYCPKGGSDAGDTYADQPEAGRYLWILAIHLTDDFFEVEFNEYGEVSP